ncbi:hypothetical protein LLG95_05370 [bacterium]|nr:hypothetical protein [bacterium]
MLAKITHNFGEAMRDLTAQFKARDAQNLRLVKTVPIQAMADIQRMSPVDTGRFRASHNLSMDEMDDSIQPDKQTSSENNARAKEQLVNAQSEIGAIPDLKRKLTIWICNNLPYAYSLEMGHSKQAPNGIYAIARQRAENLINRLKDMP